MYLVGIIILGAALLAAIFWMNFAQAYLNLASAFLIMTFVLPLLFSSGLFRDFINGLKAVTSKENRFTEKELNKSLMAVTLAMKLTMVAGVIGLLVGAIAILSRFGEASKMGPFIALSLLSLLYSLFVTAILLPVQARLKSLLLK